MILISIKSHKSYQCVSLGKTFTLTSNWLPFLLIDVSVKRKSNSEIYCPYYRLWSDQVGILRFFTVLETFSSSVGEIKRSNLRFARVFFSKNSNCCQVLRNKIILILTFSNIEFFSLYHSLTENLHALLGLSLNGTNERKKIKCMNEFSDFVINTGLFHSIEKIFSTFLS